MYGSRISVVAVIMRYFSPTRADELLESSVRVSPGELSERTAEQATNRSDRSQPDPTFQTVDA